MANIKRQQTISQDVYAMAGAVAEQALSGVRTVYVLYICAFIPNSFLLTIFRYAFSLQKRFEQLYDTKLRASLSADTRKGIMFGMGIGGIFCCLYMIYGMSYNTTFPFACIGYLSSLGLAFWYGSRQVVSGDMSGSDVLVVFMSMLVGTTALIMMPQPVMAIVQVEDRLKS